MLLAWATWDYVGKCCYLAQKEASKRFCLQHYTTGVMAGKKTTKTLKNSPIWERRFSDKYMSCFQRADTVRDRPDRLPWGQWGLPVHSQASKHQFRASTQAFLCQLSLLFPSSVMYNRCISFTFVADQNLMNTIFLQILDIAGSAELT